MSFALLSMKVSEEQDLVAARHRTRHVASLLGFDAQDQTRLATAVSEICRNAYRYAGGGRIEFAVEGVIAPQTLVIRVIDNGPGIAELTAILQGRYKSATGMGVGIQGARRLVDNFRIDTRPGAGTSVVMQKEFPQRAPLLDMRTVDKLTRELTVTDPGSAFEELQAQNSELLRALDELRLRQAELGRLNQELEDTNRGVLALYAELDENAERLKQANQLKSTFLSHMSHEFRTPLNSIMALTAILLERLDGPLTPEQEKQVKFVQKASQELTDMVNDLLDLAKVEAGKIDIHPAEMRVSTLFGTLRGMLRPLLFHQSVQLSFDYSEDFLLYTDEAKVSQVLRNFISNAIKFTDKGEIRVSADATEDGLGVRFSVADTGIGIAPEDQERIFQQFTQIDSPRQRTIKGTGLGLPLSKKLAELVGGRIELVSQPDAGSTFSLVVPMRFGQAAAGSKPVLSGTPPPRHRILILTGNSNTHDSFRTLLAGAGIGGAVFTNEAGAALALEAEKPDAMIIQLPDNREAGWHLLNVARESQVPAIAIGRVEDRQKAIASGAEDFAPEPLNLQDLIARLRDVLESRDGRPVLVIDDDDLARYLIRKQLSELHIRLIETQDSIEGLARAQQDRPQVIILDLMMPEVSGFETLDDLKTDSRTRDIPVVIHTSMSLQQRDRDLLLEKAVAVIDKNSIEASRLKDLIADLVGAKR
jgi:signal transduction histidine kinase/CheY-like chemotaxis protein